MAQQAPNAQSLRVAEFVTHYAERNDAAKRWAAGYGPIQHTIETQARVYDMAWRLETRNGQANSSALFEILSAADRITCAAMWLVVHQTYAQNVSLTGRDLAPDDFKPIPEGHTGGALNMVPAYVGYMAVNAITNMTRSWVMGQGHCVSAIDSVNLLLDNMSPAHEQRYSLTDEGLTQYVRDFYAYRLNEHGHLEAPLGSHVNVNTAGGVLEGGYLGFTELQYVHMPLPGERLVVFLSDGAFEEQRGSDWAPRWWRPTDCGLVAPIMIDNGRRIDQRTTFSQQGGSAWLEQHLRLNSFDPFVFDGRDPAAFVWAIYEIESRLEIAAKALEEGGESLPLPLPYGIPRPPRGPASTARGPTSLTIYRYRPIRPRMSWPPGASTRALGGSGSRWTCCSRPSPA